MSRIEEALLAYLARHPDAADTLDAIGRNWLPPRERLPSSDDVSCALERLVAAGYLVKEVKLNGDCLYRKQHAA